MLVRTDGRCHVRQGQALPSSESGGTFTTTHFQFRDDREHAITDWNLSLLHLRDRRLMHLEPDRQIALCQIVLPSPVE